MPAPSMNINVIGLELDAYWEPERFAVELDVYETHGTHAAFETDRLRNEDLLLAGIAVDRVTGPRLKREPERVMGRLGGCWRSGGGICAVTRQGTAGCGRPSRGRRSAASGRRRE